MTPEEAKQMEGVEFTYVFEDGDTIQAYVKKFDPEVGMTCYTLATETRDGWRPEDDVDADGTWCIMGYPTRTKYDMDECLEVLEGIKGTGAHKNIDGPGGFIGCVFS